MVPFLFWCLRDFAFLLLLLLSVSASTIGSVHDYDGHKQLGLLSWVSLLTRRRVCWLSGMAIGDTEYTKVWGLHSDVSSLSITLVLLGMKSLFSHLI